MLITDDEPALPNRGSDTVWATGTGLLTEDSAHPPHVHPQAQLILTIRGLVVCEVAGGLWMVPPQCGLWIPAGMEHCAHGLNDIELCILFVDAAAIPGLPKKCCTVSVSPLLRELVIEVSRLPGSLARQDADNRLVGTMLDQLVIAPVEHLHLPLPPDPRLRKIADVLTSNPADRATLTEWARRIGVSERTLVRLVTRQTGMSFGRWRHQIHIMLALRRLSAGDAVQTVAFELGYESPSAFIAMFRKVLGQPPARYLAARRRHGSEPATRSPVRDPGSIDALTTDA